jgi:hypothetical protein
VTDETNAAGGGPPEGDSGDPAPVVHEHDAPTVPVTTAEGATHWSPPTPASIVLTSTAVPKRSRNARLVGAAVGGFAVLVAGAFALRAVTADDGGAASPADAAQAFFDAIADEDMIGAMDSVLPGEQAAFREPLIDLVSELRRLEIAGEDADPSAVAGLDIEFPELDFTELPTNVDDITNVEVDGLATIVVDSAAIPLGDLILDLVGDVEEAERFEGSDPIEDYVFTTVREDGGWYVSLGYTLAERARWGSDGEPVTSPEIPTLAAAVQPQGGETPEEGMDLMLDAVEDLDIEGVIAALDPNEFAALHRYAPLFLDDAQAELDGVSPDLELSIDDREYGVVTDGSTARLTLSAATLLISADDEEIELEYGDGCIRLSGSNLPTEEVCADDVAEGSEVPALDDFGLPADELGALGETVSEAFADFEGAGITMTRVDGEWFVSPLGTMTDTMLSIMRALDRQEIDDIGEAGSQAVEAFFSGFGGSFSDPFDDDSFGDDGFDTGPDSFTAYYECVEDFDDAVERSQCFSDGIAAGTIDAYFVSAQELFPQCGLAEYYENGFADYSSLSDDDFIALYTEAQTCFEGLVASGDIDASVGVPLPLRDISCYEGRNPEAIDDIDERFDVQGEIFDCLLAAD